MSKLNPHKMARPKVRSNPSSHTAEMSATNSPSRTGTVAGIASGLSIVRRQTARSFTTAWVAIRAAPAWVAGGDRRPGNAHTRSRPGPRRHPVVWPPAAPPFPVRARRRDRPAAQGGSLIAHPVRRLLPEPATRPAHTPRALPASPLRALWCFGFGNLGLKLPRTPDSAPYGS